MTIRTKLEKIRYITAKIVEIDTTFWFVYPFSRSKSRNLQVCVLLIPALFLRMRILQLLKKWNLSSKNELIYLVSVKFGSPGFLYSGYLQFFLHSMKFKFFTNYTPWQMQLKNDVISVVIWP